MSESPDGDGLDTRHAERIHPWECPDCGDDGAPILDSELAVYRCVDCGYTVPIDEVGP